MPLELLYLLVVGGGVLDAPGRLLLLQTSLSRRICRYALFFFLKIPKYTPYTASAAALTAAEIFSPGVW